MCIVDGPLVPVSRHNTAPFNLRPFTYIKRAQIEFVLRKSTHKCLVAALTRVEIPMEMARRSSALLCVLLYHAAPALAFVAPGALAPCRPAFQVPLRSRDTPGAVPPAC